MVQSKVKQEEPKQSKPNFKKNQELYREAIMAVRAQTDAQKILEGTLQADASSAKASIQSGRDNIGNNYHHDQLPKHKVTYEDAKVMILEPNIKPNYRLVLQTVIDRHEKKLMYDEMREYIKEGLTGKRLKSIVKKNGEKLNKEELIALAKLLPRTGSTASGRNKRVLKDGVVINTTYSCPYNLAGRLFACTLDGYMVELPIQSDNVRCGHSSCHTRSNIKHGCEDDLVFMVVPFRADEIKGSLFVNGVASTIENWNNLYHDAIYVNRILKDNLPLAKYRALMGFKYIPKSDFSEVIVLISKMLGLANVGFVPYMENKLVMDNLFLGVDGSSVAFKHIIDSDPEIMSHKFTNYAWGIHHMCQLKAMYPTANIPITAFVHNISALSRKGSVAMSKIVQLYESEYDKLMERTLKEAFDEEHEDRALNAKKETQRRLEEYAVADSIPEQSYDPEILHRLSVLQCVAAMDSGAFGEVFTKLFDDKGFKYSVPSLDYDKYDAAIRYNNPLTITEPPDIIDNFDDYSMAKQARLLKEVVLRLCDSTLEEVD